MGYVVLILFGIVFGILISLVYWYHNLKCDNNYEKCNCNDTSQCDVWCVAKENFSRHNNYSIQEVCHHPITLTRLLHTTATCETTVEVCADCHKELTQPKTDCV